MFLPLISQPRHPTRREYLKELRRVFNQETRWAADTILWPAGFAVLTFLVSVYILRHATDIADVFAYILALAFGLIGFGVIQAIRAPWKRDQERQEQFDAEHKLRLGSEAELKESVGAKELKARWEKLKQEFASGFQPYITAAWSRKIGSTQLEWRFHSGGWDEYELEEFRQLTDEAGNLVRTSQYVKDEFPDLIDEPDPIWRWMNVLCALNNHSLIATGSGHVEAGHIEGGYGPKDLVNVCINTCGLLAAKEVWPKPQ